MTLYFLLFILAHMLLLRSPIDLMHPQSTAQPFNQ